MLTQTLTQILRGTPIWVYPLFVGLIVLGYLQSKLRNLKPARLAILPVAHAPSFAAAASFGFGLLSGAFLARALWVWSQRSAQLAFNHA